MDLVSAQTIPAYQNPQEGPKPRRCSYKKAMFNTLCIKYTSDHCFCNDLFVPISINKLCVSDRIYIHSVNNTVYGTRDMNSFDVLCHGTLLGAIDEFIVVHSSYIHLYFQSVSLHAYYFFLEDNRLRYRRIRLPASQQDAAFPKEDAITSDILYSVYKKYIVAAFSNLIIFIHIGSSPDLETYRTYCLEHPIVSLEKIKIHGLSLLQVNLATDSAYFYHSQLIGDNSGKWSWDDWYFGLLPIERNIFTELPRRDKLQMLEKNTYTLNESTLEKHSSSILHRLSGPSEFLEKYEDQKYAVYYSKIKSIVSKGIWHSGQATVVDIETFTKFLNRKYSRIFTYNPDISDSANLAYRIIAKEKEAMTLKPPHIYSTKSLKVLHGNAKIREIMSIMMEMSIKIVPDVSDVDNIRQKMFFTRISATGGLLYMGHVPNAIELLPTINNVPIENKLSDGMLFMMGIGYGSVSESKEAFPETLSPFVMGQIFGSGLCNSLDDDLLLQFIRHIKDPKYENYTAFILFILSTVKTFTSNGRTGFSKSTNPILELRNAQGWPSNYLNQVFLCYLQSNAPFISQDLLTVKKSSIIALAFYNLNSNNRIVYEYLLDECKRTGTVDPERNSEFYDRNYRLLAALSASLVYSILQPIKLSDSFCELIINGMSFIGKRAGQFTLYRDDTCLPEEIFYSELFTLLNDLSLSPEESLQSIKLLNGYDGEAYRMAARVLYAALKYFIGPDVRAATLNCDDSLHSTYKSLHANRKKHNMLPGQGDSAGDLLSARILQMALALEEVNEKNPGILFDYCLYAASIVSHSSLNTSILRVLRRRLLLTHTILNIPPRTIFNFRKNDVESWYLPGYRTIQLLKISIGLITCKYGTSRLSKDISTCRQLIVTFFVCGNNLTEYDPLDVLRLVSVKSLCEDKQVMREFSKKLMKRRRRKLSKQVMDVFMKELEIMNDLDKKFVYDVLSDYYENYHWKESKDMLFDMSYMAKIMAILR